MRVHGLLSWYEESAAWLAATATSLAGFCDTLTAVDGAYELYPAGHRASGLNQYEALRESCYASGLGLTIHTPTSTWRGNEVEKRAFLFRLGLAVAEPDDWFFIIDGDTILHPSSDKVAARTALLDTALDVADVAMWLRVDRDGIEDELEPGQPFFLPRETAQQFRSLFRALPGLTVEGLHYNYTTVKDGRRIFLWHPPDGSGATIEPSLDLSHLLLLEHRNANRELGRKQDARAYYAERDRLGIERVTDYRAEVAAERDRAANGG